MKRILNILNVLSYYLLLISFCVLYGTSTVNEESAKMTFSDDMILVSWGFFFLFVLITLINLIYHLVLYFKKRKVEEIEETIDRELMEYNAKESHYLPYFLLSLMKNERDIKFFSFHVVAFSLYSVLIYFQKTLENRIYYFYVVFLLGVLLFIVLLAIIFLLPLSIKQQEGKREYEYRIHTDYFVRTEEEREEMVSYYEIQKMKETKFFFLILTKDKKEYILDKEKLNEEAQTLLKTIQKEKKYDRLLTIKKQK